MTTSFTASDGRAIEAAPNGVLLIAEPSGHVSRGVKREHKQALREYFQHERDQELGRWRDPEAPDVVVYHLPSAKREATGRRVRVLDERLGATVICSEHLERSSDPTNAEPSAARYFAAHPEPKPWHDAQDGELWILTINGEQEGALAWRTTAGPQFETATGTLNHYDPDITAGRRIWPTGDDDE